MLDTEIFPSLKESAMSLNPVQAPNTFSNQITNRLKRTFNWTFLNSSILVTGVALLAIRHLQLSSQIDTLSRELGVSDSQLKALIDCETDCKQLAADRTWETLSPEHMILLKTTHLAVCKCKPIIERLFIAVEKVIQAVAQKMGAPRPGEFTAIHDLTWNRLGILPNRKIVFHKDLVYSLNGWEKTLTQKQIQGMIAHEIAHGMLNHSVSWLEHACSPGGKMQIPSETLSKLLPTLNAGFQVFPNTETVHYALENIFASLGIKTLPVLQSEKTRLAGQIIDQLINGFICSPQRKILISPEDAEEIAVTLNSDFETPPKTKTAQYILEKILASFDVNPEKDRVLLAYRIRKELKAMNRFRFREQEFEADALTVKDEELAVGLWEYFEQLKTGSIGNFQHYFDSDSHPSILDRIHRLTKAICRTYPKNEKFCALEKMDYPFGEPSERLIHLLQS